MVFFKKILVPRAVGIAISLIAMGVIVGFGFVPKVFVQWRALGELRLAAAALQRTASENERLKAGLAELEGFLKSYRDLEYPGMEKESGQVAMEFKGDDHLVSKMISDVVNNRRYKLEELELNSSLLTPFIFEGTKFKVRLQLRYSKLVVP